MRTSRAGMGGGDRWRGAVWIWLLVVVVFGVADARGVWAAAHQHLNAGAYGSQPGAGLYFVNGSRFAAESGYVVGMEHSADGVHAGLYRGGITLTALPSSLDYGGPTFDHAAPGAHLEVVVVDVDGPAGGRFGFWEQEDGEEGTRLTFDVPVGTRGGTNRFSLSETDGSPGVDPYGHVHGRVFTCSEPGLYTVGLRVVDTSGNGAGGGPLHGESEVYRLRYQAGVSVGGIEVVEGGVRVWFGALEGYRYQLETSGELGPGAVWEPVGEVVVGDQRVREVVVPGVGGAGYYRIRQVDA